MFHGSSTGIGVADQTRTGTLIQPRIALEEVLARFPEWQVDHDKATRLHTSTVRGWINVPVRV